MLFKLKFLFMFLILTNISFGQVNLKTSILGFGCFWCTQHDMEGFEGVVSAIPGYSGGDLKNPTYSNHEGHIEVVKITYDPQKVSYEKLLGYFWRRHDPTDGGGSFCDRGHAYRNVIFYTNESEKKIAIRTKKETEKVLKEKAKTLILPAKKFTLAEDYHNHYAKKNPIRYKIYRWNCGRDQRLKKLWK